MIVSLLKTNVRCIIFYLGLKLGVCVSSHLESLNWISFDVFVHLGHF